MSGQPCSLLPGVDSLAISSPPGTIGVLTVTTPWAPNGQFMLASASSALYEPHVMQAVGLTCRATNCKENTWTSITSKGSSETNRNSTIYVDGHQYALTAAGVQAAINAACSGRAPGTVIIQPATISLNTMALTVPNHCDIGGSGQGTTKLTFTSGAMTSIFSNAAASPMNIHIHDLTMDGGSGTSAIEGCIGMIQVTAPKDITIDRVTCQNVGGSAMSITGTASHPGTRVRFLSNRIINAGLATGSMGQLYGILFSFNSHSVAKDNEVAAGAITCGICAFSSVNASSPTPIADIQIVGNRIHDLPFKSTPGAAIDIGRARRAVAANNVIWNLAQGGCVFFESVWEGSIRGNWCSVADTVLTGGPIVVKIPDTTQRGEVASQDIAIADNAIVDNSTAATTNGGITLNGAQRNIAIRGNAISYLKQPSDNPASIYLQLGTNDGNISASSQNFCGHVTVQGNTVVGRAGSLGSTMTGIQLQQNGRCTIDQIVIADNTLAGLKRGIFVTGGVNNGIIHAYVHGNSVEGNTTGLATDGKTYSSLVCRNNDVAEH